MIALINSSAPPTAIPNIRKGRRQSQTKGYRMSATRASGQHTTRRMHQSKNLIMRSPLEHRVLGAGLVDQDHGPKHNTLHPFSACTGFWVLGSGSYGAGLWTKTQHPGPFTRFQVAGHLRRQPSPRKKRLCTTRPRWAGLLLRQRE